MPVHCWRIGVLSKMQTEKQPVEPIAAKRGWQWLMQAGDIIGRYPSAFVWLAVAWAAIGFIRWFPLLGALVLVILTPALQAGAMIAFARATDHQQPQAMDLFAGLKSVAQASLIKLGGLLILWAFLALIIASLLAAVIFPELLELKQIDEQILSQLSPRGLFLWLACMAVVMTLISLAFFFAVPRVTFDGQTPSSALAESFRACLREWRALLYFGLAQIIVSIAVWLVISVVLALTSFAGDIGQIIGGLVMNIVLTLLQILVCAGQYLAWKDVFSDKADDSEASKTELDQPGRLIA